MNSVLYSILSLSLGLVALCLIWGFWTSRMDFFHNRESASPFECGFDPKDKARIPFSLRFFLIVLLFLIFDLEISMLLQIPFMSQISYYKGRVGVMLFLWMLTMGTFEEWRRGVLKWKS